MIRTAIIAIVCLLVSVGGAAALPETASGPQAAADCATCHACPRPTTASPCLHACPRHREVSAAAPLAPGEGPDAVLLDELEDLYDAVPFSHRTHARMAAMDRGCVACHHHSPTADSHPPCKQCHSADLRREDIAQPGLKGAYHRQCMGCHQEWSGDTECELCHAMKVKRAERGDAYEAPHYRPCKEPVRKVYETGHGEGPVVTFFHASHSTAYGLECSDCHQADSCVRCHYQQEEPPVRAAAAGDPHGECAGCHDSEAADGCDKCHAPAAREEFRHGSWPLGAYHGDLPCQRCHPAGQRLAKVGKRCNRCHGGWATGTFDHAVVGLALDEIHGELDCEACHLQRRFEAAPDCSDCHDDKAHPDDRPGRSVAGGP